MLLIVIIVTTTFGKTNKFYIIASLISVRFLYSVVNDLFVLTSLLKFGWHKWTRTTDLALIRRAL